MMSVLSVKFLSMILLFGPDGSYMSAYKKKLFNFINVDATIKYNFNTAVTIYAINTQVLIYV